MTGFFELGGSGGARVADLLRGEFGWELHVPAEQAGHLWTCCAMPACRTGSCPSGSASTGRRRGLRRVPGLRAELTPEYDPVEAGMTRRG